MTAIIDGCGSCGAALGPLLTGYLSESQGGFDNVFAMLYAASLAAALLLIRLVVREVRPCLLFPLRLRGACGCWAKTCSDPS